MGTSYFVPGVIAALIVAAVITWVIIAAVRSERRFRRGAEGPEVENELLQHQPNPDGTERDRTPTTERPRMAGLDRRFPDAGNF